MVQTVFDLLLNEDWFVNVDVKYIDKNVIAKMETVRADTEVAINPLIFSICIGREF